MSHYKWLGTYGSNMRWTQSPLCEHLWAWSSISSLTQLSWQHISLSLLNCHLFCLEPTLPLCFFNLWGTTADLTWHGILKSDSLAECWHKFNLQTIEFELVLVGYVVFSRFEHAQSSNMNKIIFKLCIFSSNQTLFAIGRCLLVG
jgi:hypothetical protein